jgi:hypothetical protein
MFEFGNDFRLLHEVVNECGIIAESCPENFNGNDKIGFLMHTSKNPRKRSRTCNVEGFVGTEEKSPIFTAVQTFHLIVCEPAAPERCLEKKIGGGVLDTNFRLQIANLLLRHDSNSQNTLNHSIKGICGHTKNDFMENLAPLQLWTMTR